MAPSPSHSQSPPHVKDPPDIDPEPRTSPSRPTIQIRTPTMPQPSQHETQLEPPASTNMSRPPFAPFFTLITDSTTGTIHHPRNIHYLFSDDDPTLLTSACLSALEDNSHSPSTSQTRKDHNTTYSPSTSNSHSPSSSTNAGAKPSEQTRQQDRESENRILILDLDASGTSVTKAHSLSSSWQIVSTNLMPAPTWAEAPSPSDAQSDDGNTPNLMLRIAGTDGGRETSTSKPEAGPGKVEGEAFEALMRDFDERMRVLRTVVEAGEVGDERLGEKGEGDAEMLKEV